MKKNDFLLIVVIVAAIIAFVLPQKGSNSVFSFAKGGLNLKELNQKDTAQTKINVNLEFNQTTMQNLEQAVVIGNYFLRRNGLFVGAGIVGGVSTEFGVCCPTMFVNMGLDFDSYKLEYKVGNFKRTTIMSGGLDPQFANDCLSLGEGAGAVNAMQVSLITKNTKIGFGHQGINSFYQFDGAWYAYMERRFCKELSLAGGVDFNETTTGYVAAKLSQGNNALTLTANKLGTETQSFVATYNRENISVMGKTMTLSASAWGKATEQGLHLVTGLKQTKNCMLFAEVGSKLCQDQLQPYCGLGASFNF